MILLIQILAVVARIAYKLISSGTTGITVSRTHVLCALTALILMGVVVGVGLYNGLSVIAMFTYLLELAVLLT